MSTKKVSLQSDSKAGVYGDIHLDAATLHHAYCLVGELDVVRPSLLNAVARDLALPAGHSDLLVLDYASLTIDEARQIRDYASTRAHGLRRALIISARAITREAQNALLKSFEDPGEGVHFFLIIPSAHILLPTLKSRLSFIDIVSSDAVGDTAQKSAQDFLSMSYKDRLEYIKDLADDIKDGTRQKHEAIELLKNLQKAAAERFSVHSPKVSVENALIHKELLTALSFANDTSASLKMILEHVALGMPQLT